MYFYSVETNVLFWFSKARRQLVVSHFLFTNSSLYLNSRQRAGNGRALAQYDSDLPGELESV